MAHSLRDLQCNLFLSGSLKYSFQSFCRQSDETNGKMHYQLTGPMMRSYRMGGEWEGEQEPGEELVGSWRLPLTAAEEHRESLGCDRRWRGGSVEEVSGSPGPGAPDMTGDLSRYGQARRLRRSPRSRSADGINNRRHFSLWTRREECQSSRDHFTYSK